MPKEQQKRADNLARIQAPIPAEVDIGGSQAETLNHLENYPCPNNL